MTGLDDLRLLRTFVRIAESASISAAARALNLPQPSVSRQLRQLEIGAGVVLLRRDTHGMSLTAAGETLLADARELLGLAEIASERIRQERNAVRGHLRVVAVLDTGQWIVPGVLAAFRRLHPEVTFELHLTNRPSHFIQEGYDCGILVGPLTDRSVATRKAGEIRRMLVASPDLLKAHGWEGERPREPQIPHSALPTPHWKGEPRIPRRPADLKRLPWMGVLQPHFFLRDRITLRRGREQRVLHFSPVLLMDGVTALREAAIAGAGMTVQPEWLLRDSFASGKLVRILPEWTIPSIPVHIVFPTGRLPNRLRAFIDFVASELPGRFAADATQIHAN